jgi:hypothetical protein
MNINKLRKRYDEYVKLKLRQKLLDNELLKRIPQKEKDFQKKYENKQNNEESNKKLEMWRDVNNMIKENDMNDITIYVTSFNRDMYIMSGHLLIETFIKYNPKDFLVVCYEEMIFQSKYPQIIPFNLSESNFLREWLIENADNIPHEYGGNATVAKNPKLYDNYFNKSASKWFRKIVSIDMVIKTYGKYFKYVVWLDADCYARESLPKDAMDKIFQNHDVIYHLSNKRKNNNQGIESGIIGFRTGKGYDFMNIVSDKFRSGDFKKYSRWDDGWVFREVVDELRKKYIDIKEQIITNEHNLQIEKDNTNNAIDILDNDNLDGIVIDEIKMLDLVGDVPDTKIINSEVIPYGPFKNYFIHDKGKHNNLRGAKVKNVNYNKFK